MRISQASKKEALKYHYRAEWSDEKEQYLGKCKEFKDIYALGDTEKEATHAIQRTIAECLDMLKKDGSPIIPPPAPEFEEPCLFCEMVAGRVFVHRVWEDDDHLAFLSSFPNTEGFTVVIPKEHYPSDVCELSYDARADLMEAAAHVAKMLNRAFADVGRTGIMFEGFGIDHVHAKLFPMHGSRQEVWAPIKSKVRTFFKKYEGFFSSNDGPPMSRERLARIAKKIIEANHKT